MTVEPPHRARRPDFDVCGPLPTGHHRAGGQRRHGQDVHDRRPGRPLPRRGTGRAGPADAGHLRPDGHQRAPAAGPGPAGRRWRRPGRRGRSESGATGAAATRWWPLLTDVPPDRAGPAAATGSPGPWPTSTRPPSPPPTSSACRCSTGWACSATASRRRVFVEQLADLTREVATDLYLRRYATEGQPPMTLRGGGRGRRASRPGGHARLVPGTARRVRRPRRRGRAGGVRREAVRAEVRAAQASGRLFTYDDMLTRLRDALADPQHGAAAAPGSGERYRVVMVDEFQDTDPVQWEILRRAFAAQHADPDRRPQAGDLRVPRRRRLQLPRRGRPGRPGRRRWPPTGAATRPLLDGLDRLMGGAALGDQQIVVRPVRADHADAG